MDFKSRSTLLAVLGSWSIVASPFLNPCSVHTLPRPVVKPTEPPTEAPTAILISRAKVAPMFGFTDPQRLNVTGVGPDWRCFIGGACGLSQDARDGFDVTFKNLMVDEKTIVHPHGTFPL